MRMEQITQVVQSLKVALESLDDPVSVTARVQSGRDATGQAMSWDVRLDRSSNVTVQRQRAERG